MTTLAGTAGMSGSTDGTGAAARFYSPYGVAVDSAGNFYVADSSNDTIRKVTAAGVVTTLAGTAGMWGSTDGTGAAARFNRPEHVAVDSAGNVYVADSSNHTIRKVTAATGVVTTLAGTAGISGSTDGPGTTARFNNPAGVAVDSAGNVYVAEEYNYTIRKITAAGVVTTLAGTAGISGSTDGTSAAARFNHPHGVAVDSAGNVYVADQENHTIRKITPIGGVTSWPALRARLVARTAWVPRRVSSTPPAWQLTTPAMSTSPTKAPPPSARSLLRGHHDDRGDGREGRNRPRHNARICISHKSGDHW